MRVPPRARRLLEAAVRGAAARVGLDVVPANFYSPIPAARPPDAELWKKEWALVFLPYEYPRYLIEQEAYFNEQYIVHAFLTKNERWEILLAACALYKRESERLGALIPSVAADHPDPRWSDVTPAAFWLRAR